MKTIKKCKKKGLINHLKKIGFTNRLSLYVLLFLVIGLAGGFYLAVKCIQAQYVGALACWTVVFTPLGTAISLTLGKTVDKSKAENMSGNGDGIKFASAQYNNFVQQDEEVIEVNDEVEIVDIDSPAI